MYEAGMRLFKAHVELQTAVLCGFRRLSAVAGVVRQFQPTVGSAPQQPETAAHRLKMAWTCTMQLKATRYYDISESTLWTFANRRIALHDSVAPSSSRMRGHPGCTG
eukprot:8967714-Alexandrium_andersonii.AAC.1